MDDGGEDALCCRKGIEMEGTRIHYEGIGRRRVLVVGKFHASFLHI